MLRPFCFVLFLLLCHCQGDTETRFYRDLSDGWMMGEKISFDFSDVAEDTPYQLFIYVRNNDAYAFSNIFILASVFQGEKEISRDTLEYAMAAPDGQWLGKGFLSLKESKLWWKENYRFPAAGNYTIVLEQAMRHQAAVEGLKQLDGIVSLGIGLHAVQINKP